VDTQSRYITGSRPPIFTCSHRTSFSPSVVTNFCSGQGVAVQVARESDLIRACQHHISLQSHDWPDPFSLLTCSHTDAAPSTTNVRASTSD